MTKKKLSPYEVLIYVALGYYILIGLVFLFTALSGGNINIEALIVVAAFGVQAYYMNKLVNLILGILLLGVSIYWVLEFLLIAGRTGYDLFVEVMLGMAVASLIFSGILIFSYTKLSFRK